jgi:hypothetical protein
MGRAGIEPATLGLRDKQRFEVSCAFAPRTRLAARHRTEGRLFLAVLALLAAIPGNRLEALALAELLSGRRGMERPCETLVAWAGEA